MFHPVNAEPRSRRDFLRNLGGGFGSVALAAMAQQASGATLMENPLAPKKPHFPPRAKRVIILWMQGGPSQMDLFDYKPKLRSEAGNPIPFKVTSDKVRFEKEARLMPPVSEFKQAGQTGTWISELMP